MDPTLMDKLCDPYTHEAMAAQADQDNTRLLCSDSGNRFIIRNGIPVFLRENQVKGRNLKYQRLYDSCAPFYDPAQRLVYWFLGGEARARSEYLNRIEVNPGGSVLEVSVGTGGNIRFLRRDAEYFGLDISWGQLQQCVRNQARYGFRVRLVQGEAEYLPFRDASSDVVWPGVICTAWSCVRPSPLMASRHLDRPQGRVESRPAGDHRCPRWALDRTAAD